MDAIEILCDVLIEQNKKMYILLKNGKINQTKLKQITVDAISGIKKAKELAKSGPEFKPNNEPEAKLTKEEKREKFQNEEHEKLVSRIEKIKNDKRWRMKMRN